ncbi:uncharacterized protein LOC128206573 [Mya arenaria]|uniref:uncharacterized protein LOC128206508 n=1 Tax=Mya arenaria TaxID=6604 RepID=UPI0022E6A30B|nr:uncharacterized protein LOC128206508 [Mya arenaria]XP_052765107.1 uncharacterized protein LOC128206573 [Mya arenaria]
MYAWLILPATTQSAATSVSVIPASNLTRDCASIQTSVKMHIFAGPTQIVSTLWAVTVASATTASKHQGLIVKTLTNAMCLMFVKPTRYVTTILDRTCAVVRKVSSTSLAHVKILMNARLTIVRKIPSV